MTRQKAFTLIELLVVIAIIALLISILLPSLNKAKSLARQVVCTTQCKQMAQATHVYSQDWDGMLPPAFSRGYPYTTAFNYGGYNYGHCLLIAYLGGTESEMQAGKGSSWSIFQCPNDPFVRYNGWNAFAMMDCDYIQYCGAKNPNYPGASTHLSDTDVRSVLFSDTTIFQAGSAFDWVWTMHDFATVEFEGANAARADGSADWTSAGNDPELNFFFIEPPGGFGYMIPKFR